MKWLRRLAYVLVGLAAMVVGLVAWVTQPVLVGATQGPAVAVDPEALKQTVLAVAKPRDVKDPASLDATAAYLTEQLTAAGLHPFEQTYQVEGSTYRNVRVVFGDAKAPRVVIGAHYDSCKSLPAADDNASGVAVLLELGRLFAAHAPPGALELVFWTLEEPPVFREPEMGSAQHAKALADEHVKVTAALSLETVGFYSDEEGSQHFPAPGLGALYSTKGNYVAIVSRLGDVGLVRTVKRAMRATEQLDVYSINAPVEIPGIDWSDHRSYWPYDIPAAMITDTAPNRNRNYHRASDTPDTLNYARMAGLTRAVFEAAWVLSKPDGG